MSLYEQRHLAQMLWSQQRVTYWHPQAFGYSVGCSPNNGVLASLACIRYASWAKCSLQGLHMFFWLFYGMTPVWTGYSLLQVPSSARFCAPHKAQ